MPAPPRYRIFGITLIELMVVVAILAILTAIAIPNYTQYVQRGARADAKSMLLLAAQWLERNRGESNSYALTPGGKTVTLPAGFSQAPADGAARYTVALGNLTATTFDLTATPTGGQAGDECGDLRVDQTGARCLVSDPAAAGCTGQTLSGNLYNRCWGR